ncbi:MAG: Flp family type IVb pilin [Firmicutes bacterium]|nr:Flp family type IVb pilin [Bacillota bacterium]
MLKLLKRLVKEESGQAMVEYGLIIAVIAIAVVAVLVAFRDEIANVFNRATTALRETGNEENLPTPP